jgi:hypothetical protein
MDLRVIGRDGMYWIDLAQDMGPMDGLCEYSNKPSGSIKYWEILE